MTYLQRRVAEYQEAAKRLSTPAQADRRLRALEGQVQRGRAALSRAEGRRRQTGARVQSQAEVKAHAKLADLELELSVVGERRLELGG
jgi:hypothetical protein